MTWPEAIVAVVAIVALAWVLVKGISGPVITYTNPTEYVKNISPDTPMWTSEYKEDPK